jgi:hypothetical protein
MRQVALIAAVAGLVGLSGCAGSTGAISAPDVTVVATPSLQPGTALPAPTEPPLLTVTGRIGTTNSAGALQLDAGTFDRLGRVEVTVFDPWIKQDIAVQGIWLADLLTVARADGGASAVHLVALDNYEVDLSMADVRAGGILLATRTADGSAIPVTQGGPTRIVFVDGNPTGSRPELWIWSLTTIDVR